MRTTLRLDDDVLLAVKERARRERRTAGEVLSELARQALTTSHATTDPEDAADLFRFGTSRSWSPSYEEIIRHGLREAVGADLAGRTRRASSTTTARWAIGATVEALLRKWRRAIRPARYMVNRPVVHAHPDRREDPTVCVAVATGGPDPHGLADWLGDWLGDWHPETFQFDDVRGRFDR